MSSLATGRPAGRASAADLPPDSPTTPSPSPTTRGPPGPSTTSPKRKLAPTTKASASKRTSPSKPRSRAKASSIPFDTKALRNDRLGTLVSELCKAYLKASSWSSFVNEFRGPSYLSSSLDGCDHPAAALLRLWRDWGVPAETTSKPWTDQQKDECIRRGCHRSATEHSEFLREEMADFIENRFWMVLPYELIRHLEQLMMSPSAVKEERERKPRLLCDHSGIGAGHLSMNQRSHTLPPKPCNSEER